VFEISPSAAEVIRRMTCAVPGVEGVRIAQAPAASSNGSAPQICVVVAPAAGPLDDDRTLMEDGVAVFVDCAIAAMLDDKRLEVVPAGADQLQFTLTDQQLP
jgi:hypothetical protein